MVFDSSGNLFVATNTPDDSGIEHATILKITSDVIKEEEQAALDLFCLVADRKSPFLFAA